MSVQRISSFKSFTEVKNQQASIKMHEENKTKREQLLAKIGQTLEEEGVTSFDELDEEKRTALVAKIFNEDRAEDIEAAKVKMGEPKKHEDEEGKKVQSTNESLVTEATRSQIGKIDKAGKITSVYVHWDGSPDTRIPLLKNYKDSKSLNKLLDLGKYGISSLEKQIGDKPQDFNNPEKGITTFYGRDRNEKNDMTMKSDVKSIAKYLKDAGNHSSAEYVYLFDERDGKWYMADVYDDKELKPVKESLEVNEALSPEQKMVEDFLKKIAKEFDYSMQDAAGFVIFTISKMGLKESVEVNEDIDIHDNTSVLMQKLQVQIGNLLHAAKGNKEWTKELEAIKSAFEKLEDRFSIASKKLGMIPESVEVNEASLRNSNEKPAELTKDETMAIAQKFADAISKVEGKKVTVNKRTLEEDSFDLDIDGEEFDGGSYMIFRNGNVRNAALPKNPIYGKTTDSVATIVKNLKSIKESLLSESKESKEAEAILDDLLDERDMDELHGMSMEDALDTVDAYGHSGSKAKKIAKELWSLCNESLNEARSIARIQNEWTKVTAEMKSTVDSWKKAEGDAKAPLLAKLKELTAKKNALESELNDAIADKDKDLELVVSEAKNNEGNAFVYAAAKAKKEGKTEFEFDGETHKVEIEDTNLKEEVNEGKYSKDQLLKLIADLDDAEIVVKGKKYIIYNPNSNNDDNAAMWGKDTVNAVDSDGEEHTVKYSDIQKFNESFEINEEDITSDEQFKEYAFKVLKQAFEADFDEAKAQEVVDGILKVAGSNYGEAVGMLTSSLG